MVVIQHMFDTLQYANQLKAAGVDDKQAEAHAMAQATVFAELVETRLATKDDVKEVEQKISLLRHEVHDQIRDLDIRIQGIEVRIQGVEVHMQGVETHLQGIESRLLFKLGSVMTAGMAVLAALITIVH